MSDKNLDIIKFKNLKEEIDREIKEVEATLEEAKECWMVDPTEEDDILKVIHDVGEVINDNWQTMLTGFKSFSSSLEEFIEAAKNLILNQESKIKSTDTNL